MNTDFTSALTALRNRIDMLDDKLIELLKDRIAIIEEVSALKRSHTPLACHIRSGREGNMHARIYDAFSTSPFSAVAALCIWRQIIGASTHLESPITVAISTSTPELISLTRDYFGRVITITTFATVSDAIAEIHAAKATIMVINPPAAATLSDWWALKNSSLKIFAALPVILAENESPLAYAAAAITPEPSESDETLYMSSRLSPNASRFIAHVDDTYIFSVAGFYPEGIDAALGVIPRPLHDMTLQPWKLTL